VVRAPKIVSNFSGFVSDFVSELVQASINHVESHSISLSFLRGARIT